VLVPVFALVLIGYLVAPRLQLNARTLSRFAYFVLVPAFVFDVLGTAKIQAALAARMAAYFAVVEIACALVGFILARLLRRSSEMTAAYILIAVFPNVGNFGLPIAQFALGPQALPAATVYFVSSTAISFVIGVTAAHWRRDASPDGSPGKPGGAWRTVREVAKTPALLALPPALLLDGLGITLPPVIERPAGLLAGALVPTMLIALGAQLAHAGMPRLSVDMLTAAGARLIAGPIIGVLLVLPFGLTGVERGAGILQASMPAAVLASIIALENDLLPDFTVATVLFSTLVSVVTLTVVLAIL